MDSVVRARHVAVGRMSLAAGCLVVCGVFYWEGRELAVGTLDAPGSGAYPRLVIAMLAVLAIGVLLEGMVTLRRAAEGRAVELPEGVEEATAGVNTGGLVIASAVTIGYVVTLPVLGFVLATAVYVVALLRTIGVTSVWRLALAAVVLTAGPAWLFGSFLNVPLPDAVFWASGIGG